MSSRFDIIETPLEGLCVIQRKPIGDARGYFERVFCSIDLQSLINCKPIVQINHTSTASRGTVRGMHFQYPPHAEMKLVSCFRGKVFDVAVDLRQNSPTFLCWHAEILSADNHKTLYIPEGFAHGFQACTDDCELLYCHTASFRPESEGGVHALDPRLAIQWPLPVKEQSRRDAAHPLIGNGFHGVSI